MNFLMDVMGSHRSVRNFRDKDISSDLMNQIFEVSQWASTSNHLQAYSVIVMREKDKKKSLSELSGHQAHIAECPVFLVFCADLNRIKLSHELEKKSMNFNFVEPLLVATVDTALFGQNVLLAAESLGLGGVFIGGIRNNPHEVCDLLNLPEHVFPLFGMCLGYPEKVNEQKPRMPLSAVVHTEQYDNEKLAGLIQEYNDTMKHYYENRTSAKRSQTWTDYVSELYKEPRRVHMAEFLKDKKFGFN
ncbi:oxygen-insensitive NADPH nitroreductase [Mesobacillus jeotgali]|uniref:oxygen-insensitive NADPH nitroreductase n=1 Tax=Mesobacillus jeotgali TaxID=129985 RepID=UPI000C8598D7|nr:oxygen-insensitive NADPH nitroreductase [Mesobacillus jeotgali]